MQTVADMRGVGVKNRGKFVDVLCGRPHSTDSLISTMVNGTLLNFGKRYEDDLRFIFDQWPKLHLGLHVQLSKKIFNCI